MKDTPATRRRIQALVAKWRPRMFLDSWVLEVKFEDPGVDGAYATCETSTRYRRATLRFDIKRFPSHESLEALVVHEMCHALLSHEQGMLHALTPNVREREVEEALEGTTTWVERCLLRAYGVQAPGF